jgi:hypothetical protein
MLTHWELSVPLLQSSTLIPALILDCLQPAWPAQEASSALTFTVLAEMAALPVVVTIKVALACFWALNGTVMVLVPLPWNTQVAPEGQLLAVNFALATALPV